ncbi:MAG: hypothetical protein P8X91_03645 [Candidatus Bathyarchaeota archaeon]
MKNIELFRVYLVISTKEELQYLLHRAWEIEKKFESFTAWKSFISEKTEYRSTFLTLARESYQHRLNLEKLLKILNLESPTCEIPETSFDFDSLLYSEIFEKTIEFDKMARELYVQILENTDSQIISSLIDRNDIKFFHQQLKQMIEDENRHIGMVKKLTGKIVRIQ